MRSPGFGVERRWRSEAWERGESKRAHEIDFWGMCSARALARRGRRALQRPFHGGVAVAAAWAGLEAAGRVARPGRLQREATGGGGGAARRVGASARRINGREGAPRRRRRRCRWTAARNRAGGGGGRKGQFCNFQKFQGPLYKQAITFKLKLKWKSAQHESCSTFQDLQL